MKVTTVIRSAIRLTRKICKGVVSLIVAKVIAPKNGIKISPVSILN